MNKTQEALEMAIKEMSVYAMQHANDWLIDDVDLIKAIKTCKEALAELEQQPKVTGFIRTLETIDKDGIETWKLEPFFTLQSLQEHDDEVIEMVVTLLKDSAWGDGIIDMRVDDLIEDVRALKG